MSCDSSEASSKRLVRRASIGFDGLLPLFWNPHCYVLGLSCSFEIRPFGLFDFIFFFYSFFVYLEPSLVAVENLLISLYGIEFQLSWRTIRGAAEKKIPPKFRRVDDAVGGVNG